MSFDPKEIGSSDIVYTSHGTVLFVDGASGELRHGSPETSPFNVALAFDGEHVRVCFYDGTSERTIACQPDCSARVDSGTLQANEETTAIASSLFTRLPIGGREFGLTAQGKFLCAEPAGQITLSRSECSDWERFHTRINAFQLSGTIISYQIDGQVVHFFITEKRDWIQSHQCRGDFYERELLDLIRLYCCPEQAFVDVGANIGNHAVFVSKFCCASQVFVFEPNPTAIKLLRINLALNKCNNVDTSYIGSALASETRQFSLSLPNPLNLGGSRLIEEATGKISSIRGDEIPFSCPIGTMKIDVEGMEFDVLAGFIRTIERWRPNIFMESFSKDTLDAWCNQHNYRIEQSLPWGNYLLVPR